MVVNRVVPHLPWVALMALSLFFYKTRLFGDSGYQLLQVINSKSVFFNDLQLTGILPQIPPLLAVWLGMPLKTVLLLNSVSHTLVFYLLFLIVYYGLRDRKSGLWLLIIQLSGLVFSFFNPVFDLLYAASFIILFFAIWKLNFRRKTFFIPALIAALSVLSSPLAFILLLFILAYNLNFSKLKPVSEYILLSIIITGAVVYWYYHQGAAGRAMFDWNYGFNKQGFAFVIKATAFSSQSLVTILRSYSEVLLALACSVIILIAQRKWLKLSIFLLFISLFAYFGIVNYLSLPPYYAERALYPIVFISFMPLITEFPVNEKQGWLNVAVVVVSVLIIYRLTALYTHVEKFKLRSDQLEELITTARQMGGDKFIAENNAINHDYTVSESSLAAETLLMSALDGDDLAITIQNAADFIKQMDQPIKHDELYISPNEVKNFRWLNKKYFHLDLGPYQYINDSTPNLNLPLMAQKMKITSFAKPFYRANDTVWIKVEIKNENEIPVFSGLNNKMYVSYFWVQNNNVLSWDEWLTPLQTDIKSIMYQHIKVVTPSIKGKLQFKADVKADGKWLGLNFSEDVLIY